MKMEKNQGLQRKNVQKTNLKKLFEITEQRLCDQPRAIRKEW